MSGADAETSGAVELLQRYAARVAGGVGAADLRAMRRVFGRPAFAAAVAKETRCSNDLSRIARIQNDLLALRDAFADGAIRRGADARRIEVLALNGGTAFFFASVLAPLTMTLHAIFAILPAVFGAIIVWVGVEYYRQAEEERALHAQLAAAMDRIISRLDGEV